MTYREPDEIANHAKNHKMLFMVSCGRDCAVMLDLMSKKMDLKAHSFVTWSYYPKLLPYVARYISCLENRYGIQIASAMMPQVVNENEAEKVKQHLDEFGCEYSVWGFRMDESLQRRGMLNKLENGIDETMKRCYPLRSYTKRYISAYCRQNRVPLSQEYGCGFSRDFRTHRGNRSYLLRHFISEEDYQAAIAQCPEVEIDYIRCCNDKKFLEKLYGKQG